MPRRHGQAPHLYVVDAVAARIETTLELADGPGAVAVTPDGSRVLTTSFNFTYWAPNPELRQGSCQPLDPVTLRLGPSIPVGRFPLNVIASADSSTAYVSNYQDNSVSVIDLQAMEVTTTFEVGSGPHGLAYLDASPASTS
ncbi:YncE family protein [Nocardia sp. CA-128927]|uniref:YncE family protein n=1 Tax=Nocardia sp. CA-128927 TaxID=3239975 RepID=UPI003D967935